MLNGFFYRCGLFLCLLAGAMQVVAQDDKSSLLGLPLLQFERGAADVYELSSINNPSAAVQLDTLFKSASQSVHILSTQWVPVNAIDYFSRYETYSLTTQALSEAASASGFSSYARFRKDLLLAGFTLFEIKSHQALKAAAEPAEIVTKQVRKKHSVKTVRVFGLGGKGDRQTSLYILDQKVAFLGRFTVGAESQEISEAQGILITNEVTVKELYKGLLDIQHDNSYRLSLHRESNVTKGPKAGKNNANKMLLQWQDADTIYKKEPHASFWQRLQMSFSKLMPASQQL